MTNFQIAMEAMQNLLDANSKTLEMFNRKNFQKNFDMMYDKLIPAFDALEALYTSVMEPDEMLGTMVDALVQNAVDQIDACKRKNQKESALMDLNMQLAVFVFPAILHYKGQFSKPMTELIQKKWKEAFPKTNVTPAELETIQSGFKRKWCYITTAVCSTFNKPDDCYELTLLRKYRDEYLANAEDGEQAIRTYYDVAPSIVKHIDEREDAAAIYQGIWESYLQPCISMIENGQNEDCRKLYTKMVSDLKEEYFFCRNN